MRCTTNIKNGNKDFAIAGTPHLLHKYLGTPFLLVSVFLNLFRHTFVITFVPQTT